MWFIGDNEQRRAGSIGRLPEGSGRTTSACRVPAPHRYAEASLSSLCLAFERRALPAEPDSVPGLGPKSRTHSSGPIRRISLPWLVCDQQSCPLPPGIEIRNCSLLTEKLKAWLLRRPGKGEVDMARSRHLVIQNSQCRAPSAPGSRVRASLNSIQKPN